MTSDLEMSDLSSRILVSKENSGCESDSDSERQKENEKPKNRRKRKPQQQQRDPATATTNGNRTPDRTEDETESQLNFEETPVTVSSSVFSSPVSTAQQERMRRRLQFFFMNPVEKWQAKRR